MLDAKKGRNATIPTQLSIASLSPGSPNLRKSLIEKEIPVLNGDSYKFSEDYIFTSPSTAAVMVMGRNANGLTKWKLQDGTTLKDVESSGKTLG